MEINVTIQITTDYNFQTAERKLYFVFSVYLDITFRL